MLLVRKLRIEQGLTQTELARRAGIGRNGLNRVENGKEPAWAVRSVKIANALGWKGDPAELFKEVDDERMR